MLKNQQYQKSNSGRINMNDLTKLTSKIIKHGMAISLLVVAGVLTSPILAADKTESTTDTASNVAKGKALHDAKCFGCHDTRQYTRKNRIVHTYEDLHARVEFCDSASNAGFSFDDLDNVVAYLNTEFYKFKK
jgi:mono/diheme cytochrome c family protein